MIFDGAVVVVVVTNFDGAAVVVVVATLSDPIVVVVEDVVVDVDEVVAIFVGATVVVVVVVNFDGELVVVVMPRGFNVPTVVVEFSFTLEVVDTAGNNDSGVFTAVEVAASFDGALVVVVMPKGFSVPTGADFCRLDVTTVVVELSAGIGIPSDVSELTNVLRDGSGRLNFTFAGRNTSGNSSDIPLRAIGARFTTRSSVPSAKRRRTSVKLAPTSASTSRSTNPSFTSRMSMDGVLEFTLASKGKSVADRT